LSVFHYLKYIVKLVHNYWEFLQKPLIGEKGCCVIRSCQLCEKWYQIVYMHTANRSWIV